MYDIVINQDGTPYLEMGDFVNAPYGRYVGQKIYQALMSMDPTVVSGTDETKPDQIISRVKAYFADYFSRDPDVETSGLSVNLVNRGGQNMSLSIEYRGTSPNGEAIGVTQGLGYSIEGGAMSTVTYDPDWLSAVDSGQTTEVDIWHFITMTEPAREIELPAPPTGSAGTGLGETNGTEEGTYIALGKTVTTAYPVYILPSDSTESATSEAVSFSITADGQMLIYPIGRYIDGYIEKSNILLNASLTSIPMGMTARVMDEYGELCILVSEGSGTLEGTATMANAKYATSVVIVKDTQAKDHVYKLRPNRGRYMAQFSKSVAPGSYVVQYKGNTYGR